MEKNSKSCTFDHDWVECAPLIAAITFPTALQQAAAVDGGEISRDVTHRRSVSLVYIV